MHLEYRFTDINFNDHGEREGEGGKQTDGVDMNPGRKLTIVGAAQHMSRIVEKDGTRDGWGLQRGGQESTSSSENY